MTDDDFEHLYERAGAALRATGVRRGRGARSLGQTDPCRIAAIDDAARQRASSLVGGARRRGHRVCRRTWNRTRDYVVTFADVRARRDRRRRRLPQRPVEFVFVAPSARNVSLVGDFNGWDASATPMRRTDGRTTWSVAVQLPAGRHVYAFVVDGDAWVADPQAPLAPEQWYGQRNSVVVVAASGDRRS